MRLAKSMLPDEAIITPFSGTGAYGPMYGLPYSEPIALETGTKRITNRQGQEIIASAFCLHRDNSAIAIGDTLTIDGERYEVVAVEPIRVGKHVHHIESYLKSAGEP